MKKITFCDKILLSIIFILIASWIFFFAADKNNNSKKAVIYSKKKIITYNLNEDNVIEVEGIKGKTKIIIKEGSLWFSESACPDKLCVKCGKITDAGQSAACLPNGILAVIKNNDGSVGETIDGIAK